MSEELPTNSSELQKLFDEDQSDRRDLAWNDSEQAKKFEKRDKDRLARVKELDQLGEIHTPKDSFFAALLYQHGSEEDEYVRAHDLAKKAMDGGEERAKWLCAATTDRLLIKQGKPQKYGTQFLLGEDGEYRIAEPIDPEVTDEERAKYTVPKLEHAVEKFKEKYNIT